MRPDSSALRQLFDHLSDALLLLDRHARITFANTAALRSLHCEAGMPLDQLQPMLGEAAVQWVHACVQAMAHGRSPPPGDAPAAHLPDGRRVTLAWQPLEGLHSALRLQVSAAAAAGAELPQVAPASASGMHMLWQLPFPASLQDSAYRMVDVNQAYLDFTGYPRETLIGIDPVELQPEEDRAANVAARGELLERMSRGPALIERRLVDAGGRERWFRAAASMLRGDDGTPLFLVTMQDSTAEHAARERADRSARELDDWFDLSPVGMVLFDEAGLLVRTNPAFDALVGDVPPLLPEASASLQQLLAWDARGPSPRLQPGSNPVAVQGWMMQSDGTQRRLRSTVRCYRTPGGQRRYMAVVEDRSIEEERDLAQMQIGALIDTAGVGIATFQESSGWVRQRQPQAGAADAASSAALQSISREIVVPESLPEYERLQQALRQAQRAEVRYAVRHPELGQRWLLTRVEPATLASGKRTTSVVTLDVTEQHQQQQRSEQLLHEMATILESSAAGIAYLRANVLVRSNRRFEAMLGLAGGGLAGSSLQELFGPSVQGQRIAADTLLALNRGLTYETEFEVPLPPGNEPASLWYALSVRRSGPAGGPIEAIAVLSDITRLKAQQTELEILARDRELMFSLSEVGIAFVRSGRIERANDALAALTGHGPAELAGLPLWHLSADTPQADLSWAREEDALRRFGRWTGERQLKRRDGQLLWVQVSKRAVAAGDPTAGIIVSYVNVDDRHRAQEAVALQAERTRAILDSVLVGIVTVGANGIEWMNRSARRMFGGDLADFIDQPIDTVATPEPEHPFRQKHYLSDLAEGQAETFECRVKARDGREFWIVGNAVATGRDEGRQLTYALLDIERRRQAEARTMQAQASLQRIIEAAPMAITLRDARTLRILQVNEVAARSVLRTPAEIVGCTPEEIFDADVAAQRRRDMEEALRSRRLLQVEYRVEENGETRIWDARYLPLASPGQPPDQLLLVATEVTEQRAAQQAKFEAALAQREMLVKEVHHRIKNNLQGVAGLLQQIALRKPEVAPAISEVVGQVQAIAQVYGLQVGVTGPLRLKSVVEAITGSVQRTFGHGILLSVEGPAPHQWALPEAESIPIALTVNELLTNAVKHSIDGRGVQVACTLVCGEEGVRIEIRNRAQLPPGFDVARFPGGVSGLGLVRSLLPRRSAKLSIEQRGDEVVATVALVPPGVTKLEPA
ncbi:PAS domain S-box protein [Piscinibacter sp. XHJ-5]|uniref:PAS domain S-box protein n=1 Tax=Piscinibacter sp. XHJ-5 TaxID=3037797 RepID=UPI002452ED51|nr:PAS domain S-box protein [Piscinibacter sp. XHJ-5]